jgi:AcrR family transcriptional regulator
MTQRVREGLFFQVPVLLPRGRHSLTREQVLSAQRERLMAAMTELMAELGYRGVRVGAVASQAGVSRPAFYDCFTDKEACAFAAYDRFIDVLLQRIIADAQPAQSWDAFIVGLMESYLGTLQQDLVVARAFQVEMDAVGPPARARRRQALVRFAEFIRAQGERFGVDRDLPMSAYVGAVYAARQIASDALDAQKRPDLLALAPELSSWMGELLGPSQHRAASPGSGRLRRAAGS